MKKVLKKILPLFLILIVAFAAISPLQLRAATKGKAQNIEMRLVSLLRSPNRKYVNANKKLIIKDEVKSQEEDKVVVSSNTKNTVKVHMNGYLYVIFYDPSGAIIDIISRNIYLKEGAIDTNDATCYLKMINYETKQRVLYDHYEIIKNAYTSELKK